MIDPSTLDDAWLLDKIAAHECHLYFCRARGSIPVTSTYLVHLDGRERFVTLDMHSCTVHANEKAVR